MRNQNIYTSRISQGLEVGSPRNSKHLDLSPRAFVVFVNNTTDEVRSFRLTIANPTWLGGEASFIQFESLSELDVTIAPHSSISRPVFVESSDPNASIRIENIPPFWKFMVAPGCNTETFSCTNFIT